MFTRPFVFDLEIKWTFKRVKNELTLGGYRVASREPSLLAKDLIKLVDALAIAAEDLQAE